METAPRGEADLVCQAPCENANRPCERSQDKAHFKEIRKKKKKEQELHKSSKRNPTSSRFVAAELGAPGFSSVAFNASLVKPCRKAL